MKEAIIISCHDNYDYDTRTKYIRDFLKKKGYNVKFLISNFDHRNKEEYKARRQDKIIYVCVNSYKKNLSLGRIIAQIKFAIGVGKYIEKNIPDIVYHCAPPNSTIAVLAKIKRKKSFFLITEIGDMWPETIPLKKAMKGILSIPLKVWSLLRDKNLYNSDIVIAECDLFRNYLITKTKCNNIKTMYFCKPYLGTDYCDIPLIEEYLVLVYLGSINNIIDIPLISLLINKINKLRKISLHIIGDGEKRDTFIKMVKKAGADIVFHGMIFDDEQKKGIFNKAHFALNIMKDSVFVGMTMKSLDYFSYGIPIINNVGGDTEKMVSMEKIGINITLENIDNCVKKIMNINQDEYLLMRSNVKCSHRKHFSVEKFEKDLSTVIAR